MKLRRLRIGYLARVARIVAAGSVLVLAVLSFFASSASVTLFSVIIPSWQLLPSLARISIGAVGGVTILGLAGAIGILLVSAILGRWYCSFLCPLGTLQDLASLARRKRRIYHESAPGLRYAALLVVLCLVVAGATSLAAWLEPWTIVGRFVAYDIDPLVRLASRENIYSLRIESIASALLVMGGILAASAFRGRWFCGTLCPAGTILGLLNRAAPFRLRLDASSCIACGRCTTVCRASCLDGRGKHLDATRCIYCLACVTVCPTGALRYGRAQASLRPVSKPAALLPGSPQALGMSRSQGIRPGSKPSERHHASQPASTMSRSQFLRALGAGAAALGLAVAARKAGALRIPTGEDADGTFSAVIPPGARSAQRLVETCLACGLCVARCPARIIRPSMGQLGMAGLFVPRMDYDISYCQYDCTLCMDVCPSGALQKLDVATKKLTKIGDSTLIRDRCIVITNKTRCGACAEHCPTGAVHMVIGQTGLPEPVFETATCIGCGACHHACPVLPDKAISVAGLANHATAQSPSTSLHDRLPASPGQGQSGTAEGGTEEFPF